MKLDKLRDMTYGYISTASLRAAIKLGIFSLVKEQPLSAYEISNRLNANLRYVNSLLHLLVDLELLEKKGDLFGNSSIANDFLIPDKPKYQGDFILHITNYWMTWAHLDERIIAGGPEFPYENGFVDAPTYWHDYIKGRHNLAFVGQADLLIQHTNLEGRAKMLDLGGAAGSYSIALCQAYAHLQAVVLDLKQPLEIAAELLPKYDLEDRINLMAADFHKDEFGRDFDVVLISAILRLFSDEEGRNILKKVYDSLLPGGLLIVQEFTPLEKPTQKSFMDKVLDLFLIVGHAQKGSDRSKEEMRAWIEDAGFCDFEFIGLPNQTTLMIANKR